ncbi:GLSK Glutaminase, partial [Polypterus senegalus]
MLKIRPSAVLWGLFQAALKRPLRIAAKEKAPALACRLGTDAKAGSVVTSQHAEGYRRLLQPLAAGMCHSYRGMCTKTDESAPSESGEPKSGSSSSSSSAAEKASSEKRRQAGLLPSLEDLLFYTIAEGQEKITVHKFITALKSTGLRTGDPRLKECMDMLRTTLQSTTDSVTLDKVLFKKCVQSNIVLLTQAFRKKFVIPDFMSFTSHIDELYESARKLGGGQVADYIPQLAKFSPDLWAASLCTVDGQRHSVGDTKVPFCLQSCVKPLKYAIAVNDLGTEYVHRYVGKEPSGLRFNKLFLNEDGKCTSTTLLLTSRHPRLPNPMAALGM